MRVLGLDPGLTCAGYGIVDGDAAGASAVAYGAIRTRGRTPERLNDLFDQLDAVIAEHRPEAFAVEKVFFNKNVRTAMSVGQAAGVALLAGARAGCDVHEYAASEVKLAVTGNGAATKAQVQHMVQRLLALDEPPKPVDAADALALAIVHCRTVRRRAIVEAAGA